MSTGKTGISMFLTIAAALGIAAIALAAICLNRFAVQPAEKQTARNLDLGDSRWVDALIERSLPPLQKDFSIYSAFSYSNEKNTLTQVYAATAQLDQIRSHYRDLLENPQLPETNSVGVLELSGEFKGREVRVKNYFSEVSNLIQVEMEMSGENAGMIRRKVKDSFPLEALEAVPEIGALVSGESAEGYVLYNHNTLTADAGAPLFSRAYFFNGGLNELQERINALGERFGTSAVTGGGNAEIKYGPWLYQIRALENSSGVKVVLIIQAIPS